MEHQRKPVLKNKSKILTNIIRIKNGKRKDTENIHDLLENKKIANKLLNLQQDEQSK